MQVLESQFASSSRHSCDGVRASRLPLRFVQHKGGAGEAGFRRFRELRCWEFGIARRCMTEALHLMRLRSVEPNLTTPSLLSPQAANENYTPQPETFLKRLNPVCS